MLTEGRWQWFLILAGAAAVPFGSSATESCGTVGVVGDTGFVDATVAAARCGEQLLTNCTDVAGLARRICPEDCRLLAPRRNFPCMMTCVRPGPEACLQNNLLTPFADPVRELCRSCAVAACKVCDGGDTCQTCFEDFVWLDGGRRCVLGLEQHIPGILKTIVLLAICLVLLAVFYRITKGIHPRAAHHVRALFRALRHRHECKVQDWNINLSGDSGEVVRQRYPLSVNVHKQNILGLGLALFYNMFVFMMVISLVCTIFTYIVYQRSDLTYTLVTFAGFQTSRPGAGVEACDAGGGTHIEERLHKFANENVVMIGVLYVVLFAISALFGWYQKVHSDSFDSLNSTMEDFVVAIDNFPRTVLPHEPQLREELEAGFRRFIPEVELLGVSIAYDFHGIAEEVDSILFHFLENLDQKQGFYEQEPSMSDENDLATVRSWFLGNSESRLKCSGTVFCVFRRKDHADAALKKLKAEPGLLVWGESPGGLKVQGETVIEPPNVMWQNFGMSNMKFGLRLVFALVRILGTFVLFAYANIFGINKYIFIPYSQTSNAATAQLTTVLGILTGWVNMLMSVNIWLASYGVGFGHRCYFDILVFFMNITLTFLNFGLAIYMVVTKITIAVDQDGFSFDGFVRQTSVEALAAESEIASSVLQALPGMFFTGLVTMPLMAGALPLLWNSFLIALVYIWACLPRPMLWIFKLFLPWSPNSIDVLPTRNTEKALEPMEVGIPWDYAGPIVHSMVCFSMLFFVSPDVWRTFAVLLLWSVFCYGWFRWIHLRFNKACFYTTHMLNVLVNYTWGIPLSVVAAAWAYWMVRARILHSIIWVVVAYVASLIAWIVCYSTLSPQNRENRYADQEVNISYDDTQADLLYTWFNTNPVFVLKCYFFPELVSGHVLPLGADGKTIVYYEVGKDYLLLATDDLKRVMTGKVQDDNWEIETHLDPCIRFLQSYICPVGGENVQSNLWDVEEPRFRSEYSDDEMARLFDGKDADTEVAPLEREPWDLSPTSRDHAGDRGAKGGLLERHPRNGVNSASTSGHVLVPTSRELSAQSSRLRL